MVNAIYVFLTRKLNSKILTAKATIIKKFLMTLLKLKQIFNSVFENRVKLCMTIFACLVVGAIFMVNITIPVKGWDGQDHWMLQAKVFYYYHQLNFDVTSDSHYPFLWPLNIACQFALLDGIYDQIGQWTSAFLFLAFVMLLVSGFQALNVRGIAVIFVLIFYLVSAFHDPMKGWWVVHFTQANGENILIAYFMGVLAACLFWFQDMKNGRYLLIAGMLSFGLSLSKVEGFVACLFVMLAFLLLGRQICWNCKTRVFIGLNFLSVLLYLGWEKFVVLSGYIGGIKAQDQIFSIEKFFFLSHLATLHIFKNNLMIASLIAFIFLVLWMNHRKWNVSEKFLLIVSLAMVIFSVLFMLGYSIGGIKDAITEIYPRYFLHASPALVLLWSSRMLR